MKERPILFSGPMVRAILAGTKTQTRRVVRPQPFDDSCGGQPMVGHRDLAGTFAPHVFGACMAKLAPCPHGQPGDRLWVRETWYCDDFEVQRGIKEVKGARDLLEYRADHDCRNWEAGCPCRDDQGRGSWRPSIHMPRWASRLTLKLTQVRVERLQDISEEDAIAEGVASSDALEALRGDSALLIQETYRRGFRHLWDSLNAKRGFEWETNPFCWVLSFRRIEASNGL